MRPRAIWVWIAFLALTAALVSSASGTAPAPHAGLRSAFREAASRYRVPERLLLAMGYVNTRLRMPGRPALDGGIGIMHLPPPALRRLARRVGTSPAALRRDPRANVFAGAALLASRRGRWFERLTRLEGPVYAEQVYETIRHGFGTQVKGETLRLPPAKVEIPRTLSSRGADYPRARWYPASPSNYSRSNRPRSYPIRMIVVHVTEGSYGGSIAWFANPRSRVSAHYVVRSSDGEVTQTVHDKDIAWHAGNSAVNAVSIGIEHEAFSSNCRWFTREMYRGSAQLVAYLAQRYGIPLDRRHIIGHAEVPDPDGSGYGGYSHHTDPGPCWKWRTYMALVRAYSQVSFSITPQRIADDRRRSSFHAPRGWRRIESVKGYGRTFRVARPSRRGRAARFRLKIPRSGFYALYGWWPASRSRNRSVPIGIDTTLGRKWIRVDERVGSGWRYLGSFPLSRKKRVSVVFSRRTKTRGLIAADAVKVELLPVRRLGRPASTQEGWTLTGKGLLRTLDGGTTWQAITPPGLQPAAIRGLQVSGESVWLVAASNGERPLELFETTDGGATWFSSPLPVPRGVDVAAPADLTALDEENLMLGLRLEPNRKSLDRGLLLRSRDGGVSWTATGLPAGGRVSFTSARDGWLLAGLSRERLYATHTGGKRWAPVRPRVPVKRPVSTAYELPTFSIPTDGVLPVSVAAGSRSSLVFGITSNRGRSWEPARVLRLRRELRLGQTVPTAIADPSTWYAAVRGKLVAVKDYGLTKEEVGPLPGGIFSLDFASPELGWAQVGSCKPLKCALRLYATQDGGLTWMRLRLP